ncbi:FAD-dependent oxidoreductase, partial [Aestuariivirga sp.]|uniref:FAD-dependent oxidoreductase n=1 Tax=Aestuariivirga sp. TaxID=2650926 RepID=UPI0035AF36E5
MERRDVVIIGGGPAGLSAARRLHELGVAATVLEREGEAGGIPRHCGHLGFGWQSHRRIWTG